MPAVVFLRRVLFHSCSAKIGKIDHGWGVTCIVIRAVCKREPSMNGNDPLAVTLAFTRPEQAPPDDASPFILPARIGRYRVENVLDRGGSASFIWPTTMSCRGSSPSRFRTQSSWLRPPTPKPI